MRCSVCKSCIPDWGDEDANRSDGPNIRGCHLAAAWLLSACEAVPGTSVDKTAPTDAVLPTTYPTPGSACLGGTVQVDEAPQTMSNAAQIGKTIVIVIFGGYGDALWNTPTGARPTPDERVHLGVLKYRPVKVTATVALREHSATLAQVRVADGVIGCDWSITATNRTSRWGRRTCSWLS